MHWEADQKGTLMKPGKAEIGLSALHWSGDEFFLISFKQLYSHYCKGYKKRLYNSFIKIIYLIFTRNVFFTILDIKTENRFLPVFLLETVTETGV